MEARVGATVVGRSTSNNGTYFIQADLRQHDPGNVRVTFVVDGYLAGETAYQEQALPDGGWPTANFDLDISSQDQAPAAEEPAAAPTAVPTEAPPQPTNTPPPDHQQLRGQVQGFDLPPEVALRPVVDEIDSDSDGVIEAWMYNSGLNKVNLVVEIKLAAPSGIHISSTDGSFTGGAGRGVAKYVVEPGQGRTIKFHVQADLTGRFTVTSDSKYWPEGREEKWNPISLSHPFRVHQATSRERARDTGGSSEEELPAASGGCTIGSIGAGGPGGGTASIGAGGDLSMMALGVAMVIGMGLVAFRGRRSGQAKE